jgi:hypothetical protein
VVITDFCSWGNFEHITWSMTSFSLWLSLYGMSRMSQWCLRRLYFLNHYTYWRKQNVEMKVNSKSLPLNFHVRTFPSITLCNWVLTSAHFMSLYLCSCWFNSCSNPLWVYVNWPPAQYTQTWHLSLTHNQKLGGVSSVDFEWSTIRHTCLKTCQWVHHHQYCCNVSSNYGKVHRICCGVSSVTHLLHCS